MKPFNPFRTFLTAHLEEAGESYLCHLGHAFYIGMLMLFGAVAALVHGVFPFLFTTTASRAAKKIEDLMAVRRKHSSKKP